MKTNNLFGIWLLFLCATVLSGCNNYLLNGKDGDEEEDNEEVWYNNIPEEIQRIIEIYFENLYSRKLENEFVRIDVIEIYLYHNKYRVNHIKQII